MGYRSELVFLRRDHGQRTFIGDLLSDLSAAIGLVCDDRQGWALPIQKGIHHLAVVQLPA